MARKKKEKPDLRQLGRDYVNLIKERETLDSKLLSIENVLCEYIQDDEIVIVDSEFALIRLKETDWEYGDDAFLKQFKVMESK